MRSSVKRSLKARMSWMRDADNALTSRFRWRVWCDGSVSRALLLRRQRLLQRPDVSEPTCTASSSALRAMGQRAQSCASSSQGSLVLAVYGLYRGWTSSTAASAGRRVMSLFLSVVFARVKVIANGGQVA